MLLPSVEFSTLVDELSAVEALHAEGRHQADRLLLGTCRLGTLVPDDLRWVEVGGIADIVSMRNEGKGGGRGFTISGGLCVRTFWWFVVAVGVVVAIRRVWFS